MTLVPVKDTRWTKTKRVCRYYISTLPEYPHNERFTQVIINLHLGTWYLLPFAVNPDVPGLWHVTWLFFTIKITWPVVNESTHTEIYDGSNR